MIYILINKPNSIFQNGCYQQSLFIYEVLSYNFDVKFLSADYKYNELFEGIDVINFNDIKLQNDIIISISGNIINKDICKHLSINNYIINYNCGNLYYIYQEDIIFGSHNRTYDKLFGNKYSHQVWTIPNYDNQLDFIESITSTYTISVPYVWNTTIIDKYIRNVSDIRYKNEIDNNKCYILIFEANINITKTCLIPLLICNNVYKSGYKNIKVLVMAKPKTDTFKKWIDTLEIRNNIELYDRLPTYEVLKQLKSNNCKKIILSHQKDNNLNFLHLEILYLGYPLIHNSNIKGGYKYNNIKEGEQHIINIINNGHIVKEFINPYSPINNADAYKKLIKNIKSWKYIIVCSQKYKLWCEMGEIIYNELDIKNKQHIIEPTEFDDNNLYIILGVHEFDKLPKNYIVYNFEQLEARFELITVNTINNYINILKNAYKIWDYSEKNIKYLRENYKLYALYMPYNYSRIMDEVHINKEIDLIFLGNPIGRRIDILSKLYISPYIINNKWFNEKREILKKSKILIDINMNNPKKSLIPSVRYADCIINKILIISEETGDKDNILNNFIVKCKNINEMNDKIKYYLSNNKEREIIVNRAYNWFITTSYKFIID